jgi:EmrB/QacA subfamily drug resistance transporter
METIDQGIRLRGPALAAVLVGLFVTVFLEALDQTVVGVALPRILAAMHGFDRYIWTVTAYVVAAAVATPIVGKLSDQFGRKGFLLGGTVLFLAGSVLAGMAQTMDQLIASRALQGLGAGTGIALAMVVLADLFPPAERVKWQSFLGVVYGLSSLLGPTLGGLLTDHGPLLGAWVTEATRWRWIFFLNLPIGVAVLVLLGWFLPAKTSERVGNHRGWASVMRIDFAGAALSAAGTVSLLLGLTWGSGGVYPWSSWQVVSALAASLALFIVFFFVESRAAEPIFPLALFRNSVFTGAALLAMLQMMILVGLVISLPFFLQNVLKTSATGSGLALTPMNFASVVGAALGGALLGAWKKPRRLVLGAGAVLALGTGCLTLLSETSPVLLAGAFMVVAGIGLGPFFSVPQVTTQNSLDRSQLGIGTSVLTYLTQLGSVLGAALVGTVMNHSLAAGATPAESYHNGFVAVFLLAAALLVVAVTWKTRRPI